MSPTSRRSVAAAEIGRAIVLLVTMSLAASLASGQQGPAVTAPSAAETATARGLFEEGVALSDGGQWAEAADRFQRVLEIRWSSAAAFNLAAALVELARLVDASELYRQVARDESAAAAMRDAAKRAVEELDPRLGRLHVLLAGDTEGVAVYVDGRDLPPAAWGVPIVVDPGTHTVIALREGQTIASQNPIVGDGHPLSVEVLLDLPSSAPAPAAVAAAFATEQPEDRPTTATATPPITQAWWFWTGAGVVAATTVAVVLVAALSSGSGGRTTPVEGSFAPTLLSGRVEDVP